MVNGVTSSQVDSTYAAYTTSQKATEATGSTQAAENTATASDVAAVYEPSAEAKASDKVYTTNTDLVNQLKADAEERTANLRSLVEKLMTSQATSYGNATDIWSFLREGKFTVDPETKAQAQKDISEDGYWGVNKTSDRIVSFATALTGGDPSKLDSMIDAFKKGYEQAEETWGGELPEISKKTYDAVLEKFEALRQQYANETLA